MDPLASPRDQRRVLFTAIALALMVGLVVPPAVNAAVQKVKVKGTVNVKGGVKISDTAGGEIDSASIPPLGTSLAPGSAGALAVRTFAGGGGLIGLGDCNSDTPVPGSFTVGVNTDRKVTAIIITGDTSVDNQIGVQAPTVVGGGYRVASFQLPADTNEFVGLGNGLTVTPSELIFSCDTAASGNNGKFVVLGQ